MAQLFTGIENKEVVLPDLGEPQLPYTGANLGQLCRFLPVKDEDKLTINVVFPDLHREYKSKPGSYFSHLIGHEGEHSLLSYLKKLGLALSLSTWPEDSLNCFSFIQVDINLTKKGLEHYDLVL